MKKAVIYDLDNTLYPVSAIGDKLFGPLFSLIKNSGSHDNDYDAIRKAIMRTPFRLVAQQFGFSEQLTNECIALQEELEYADAIATFEDYSKIKSFPQKRFLVTTGFSKMQNSKIDRMNIRADFEEIHIVNPTKSSKKLVFQDVMQRYGFSAEEVLVVGDDPESELKAARESGIEAVLYYKDAIPDGGENFPAINHFSDLERFLR